MQQVDYRQTLHNGDSFPPFQYTMSFQMPHHANNNNNNNNATSQQYNDVVDYSYRSVYKPTMHGYNSSGYQYRSTKSADSNNNNNNNNNNSGVDLHCYEDVEMTDTSVVYNTPADSTDRPELDPIFADDPQTIFERLLENQLQYHPVHFLRDQPQITQVMRGEVIFTHMMKAIRHFRLSKETLHLSVNLFDRFLTSVPVTESCLPLLAITCLRIASKKEDVSPPSIVDLICFVGGKDKYEKSQFLRLELLVLRKVDYCLEISTALAIMHCLIRMCLNCHGIKLRHGLDDYLLNECNNMVDNSLLSYDFVQYSPVSRAAACLQIGLASIFKDHSCGYLRWANDATHIGLESLAFCVIALQKAVPLAKYQLANLPSSLQYQPPSECPSPLNTSGYYEQHPPTPPTPPMYSYAPSMCYYDPWHGLMQYVDSNLVMSQDPIHRRY